MTATSAAADHRGKVRELLTKELETTAANLDAEGVQHLNVSKAARRIEEAIFSSSISSSSDPYRNRARQIVMAIKKNVQLAGDVLTRMISPTTLVDMEPHLLAPKDVQERRLQAIAKGQHDKAVQAPMTYRLDKYGVPLVLEDSESDVEDGSRD
jgi:hypothetical protein